MAGYSSMATTVLSGLALFKRYWMKNGFDFDTLLLLLTFVFPYSDWNVFDPIHIPDTLLRKLVLSQLPQYLCNIATTAGLTSLCARVAQRPRGLPVGIIYAQSQTTDRLYRFLNRLWGGGSGDVSSIIQLYSENGRWFKNTIGCGTTMTYSNDVPVSREEAKNAYKNSGHISLPVASHIKRGNRTAIVIDRYGDSGRYGVAGGAVAESKKCAIMYCDTGEIDYIYANVSDYKASNAWIHALGSLAATGLTFGLATVAPIPVAAVGLFTFLGLTEWGNKVASMCRLPTLNFDPGTNESKCPDAYVCLQVEPVVIWNLVTGEIIDAKRMHDNQQETETIRESGIVRVLRRISSDPSQDTLDAETDEQSERKSANERAEIRAVGNFIPALKGDKLLVKNERYELNRLYNSIYL